MERGRIFSPRTIILFLFVILFLIGLFFLFTSHSRDQEEAVLLPFGAQVVSLRDDGKKEVLPEPKEELDEDEEYEKNLALLSEGLFIFSALPRGDSDNDDEEDERYEASLSYDEGREGGGERSSENLEVELPKIFENQQGEEETVEVPEEIFPEDPIQQEESPKGLLESSGGGVGGGGFLSYTRGDVIFSEIAWMGSVESATHEWIELKNTSDDVVLLNGFFIEQDEGSLLVGEKGDEFDTTHQIAPGGYFLLERNEMATQVVADKLYDGSLKNSGERLILKDGNGEEIDGINMLLGWEAGTNDVHVDGYKATMSDFATSTTKVWKDGIPTPKAVNKEVPLGESDNADITLLSYEELVVVINEIAWMGNEMSSANEWIELYNTTSSTIDLSGWLLEAQDGSPAISLSGQLTPNAYFLLERSDDDSVENLSADLIYTGVLENGGEVLLLKDPLGNEIDRVDTWHAGDNESKKTMQRESADVGGTISMNWFTAPPTPKAANQKDAQLPPSPPLPSSPVPSSGYSFHDIVINEIAWMGTIASSQDEWLELKNTTSTDMSLSGWKLTFAKDASSTPDLTITFGESDGIPVGGFFVLERNTSSTIQTIEGKVYSGSQMNNKGEYLKLIDSQGSVIDVVDGAISGWQAGLNQTSPNVLRKSMERSRDFTSWYTFDKIESLYQGNTIVDAGGNPILGTPGCPNSEEVDTCAV